MSSSLSRIPGQVSQAVDQVSSGSGQVSQASQSEQNAESASEASALAKEAMETTTAGQLGGIVKLTGRVSEFLAEIAVAGKEQAQGVEQISTGLDQIEQVTQANTASAEESASASKELAAQAQELRGLVGRLRLRGTTEVLTAWHRGGTQTRRGERGRCGVRGTRSRRRRCQEQHVDCRWRLGRPLPSLPRRRARAAVLPL